MKSKIYINYGNIPVEFKEWSGGEIGVSVAMEIGCIDECEIYAHIVDASGIIALMMLVDAIRNVNRVIEISLHLPYVPYARQDRVCNLGEAFSLKVFANIINSMKFREVVINDPHSIVTPALIDNCAIIESEYYVRQIIGDSQNFVLVAPDAGAAKKVESIGKNLDVPVIYATKSRNQKSGDISNIRIDLNDVDVCGKTLLVVDDIIDGGRTFIELAKALANNDKTKNCVRYLFATHGIFSYGTEGLLDRYHEIYVSHPFPDIKSSNRLRFVV